MIEKKPRERTLILEIALPDYYAEDYRLDRDEVMADVLREFCGSDDPTPEQLGEACMEDSGETAGGFVRLLLLTGSEAGNELQHVDGFIVNAKIVPREPHHDRERDERLVEYEEEWVMDEARRIWNRESELL